MKLDSWHVTHQEVPQFAKLKGHSYLDGQYLSLSCADFAEMYTGHHLWNNCKRQTMRLTLNETPLFYERRGFLHSSGSSDDQGIRSSNSAGSIFPCLSQRFGSSVRIYLK